MRKVIVMLAYFAAMALHSIGADHYERESLGTKQPGDVVSATVNPPGTVTSGSVTSNGGWPWSGGPATFNATIPDDYAGAHASRFDGTWTRSGGGGGGGNGGRQLTWQMDVDGNVIKVDIDVDSNNDKTIESDNDNEDKFEGDSPGAIVCLDKKGVSPDGEHYVEMKLSIEPAPTSGTLTLSSANGKVKVWKTAAGTDPVDLSATGNIPINNIPSSLWIDGIALGEDTLKLEYQKGGERHSDLVALTVIDTISFSPSGTFVYAWEPVSYSGGPGLSTIATDAILDNVKDHGWNVTTARFSDSTDDDDPGVCTRANFESMKYGGIVVVDTHGTATPAVCTHYLTTRAAADAWIGGNPIVGMTVAASGSYAPRHYIKTTATWFTNNWKPTRDFLEGITVLLVCHGAEGGDASCVSQAGGRVKLGYVNSHGGSYQEPDMAHFFKRMNGSEGGGEQRTAGKAWVEGDFTADLRRFGNDWTTLNPSPLLTKKTALHDGKGASTIAFDTFMHSSTSADSAVTIVSGNASARRWYGLVEGQFGISFDFSTENPVARAIAAKCKNASSSVGRELSGDRTTYGEDKQW